MFINPLTSSISSGDYYHELYPNNRVTYCYVWRVYNFEYSTLSILLQLISVLMSSVLIFEQKCPIPLASRARDFFR